MSVICREDSVLASSDNSKQLPTAIECIIKRDGREVPFDEQKIADAMRKAFDANRQHQSDEYLSELAQRVSRRLLDEGLTEPSVEEIQDRVEEVLKESGHVITALQYSRYRKERSKVREQNSWLMKTYTDITFKDADDSDIKRENANIDGNTAMGMMLKYGSEGAKHFFKVNVMRPEIGRAHV